jgi:hypothetical protein
MRFSNSVRSVHIELIGGQVIGADLEGKEAQRRRAHLQALRGPLLELYCNLNDLREELANWRGEKRCGVRSMGKTRSHHAAE